MSEHTPGPWWAIFGTMEAIQIRADHERIALVDTCGGDGPANARRIVACVNACAGMAGPAAEIAKLRAEREELRELLWWVEAKLQPELNVSNYHHQQVCELNANATEAVLAIRAALAEKV